MRRRRVRHRSAHADAADADVIKAYAAALAAQETVRIERLSAASLTRSAEIAEDRFKAGEISDAEREQVGLAAGRFEADVRTAEAGAVQARIALQLLLGAPRPDGDVLLADDRSAVRAVLASAPLPDAASPAWTREGADGARRWRS